MKRMILASVLAIPLAGLADEGMWTLENFPTDAVRSEYDVEISQSWLDKIRLATTRIEGGCTGSFVSPDGLVLTNHHCVRRCLSQISSAERDFEETGFLAPTRDNEPRCETEQLSVLVDTEEITADVMRAIEGKEEKEANEVRKQTLTGLEQTCEEASKSSGKLSCETVSLYNGGQYFLYKYKRYEDVRLVFAPEVGIAAFGGDPDNFNFPRWCLDMAFLRAYENGRPAKSPKFLLMRAAGVREGEPVLVSGHPGSTDRLLTVADLRLLRDVTLPIWLLRYSELRGRLIQFAKTGEEPYRITRAPLLGIENAIKVRRNELNALLDEEIFARKQAEELALRKAVAANPEMERMWGSSWDDIEGALEIYRDIYEPYLFAEQGAGFNSVLFGYARSLIRAAEERQKPNQQRLREYTEAALPQLRQVTLAARPIYPELETLTLSFSLDKMREWLGPDDPFVLEVLGGQSPDALAAALVGQTQLADPEFRKMLWDADLETLRETDDAMIRLALQIDEYSRALRKRYEDEVEAPKKTASENIAKARFAIEGTDTYPDGTFTLRITFGSVTGWEEKGELVSPFTYTERLFERATGDDPFRLPESWLERQSQLDPQTRFNLVATTDITGGNSGSPVIDIDGNVVGLAFDGNIHSIAGSYWFDEQVNRTVAVHPAIMLEALRVVYEAVALLDELTVQ